MGEGGEGGGQLTFRHSGLERNGRSLTEAWGLLPTLKEARMWSPCPRTEPAGRAQGSLFASAWSLSFCLVLLFSFLLLLFYLFGTFSNSAWPSSVLSTNSKFNLFSEFPIFAGHHGGEERTQKFNVEL